MRFAVQVDGKTRVMPTIECSRLMCWSNLYECGEGNMAQFIPVHLVYMQSAKLTILLVSPWHLCALKM